MNTLKVKKFYTEAVLPKKNNPTDAGYDLSSVADYVIPPFKSALIETGIGITVPQGTYGRIAPRSGLSTKNLFVNAGVVDEGYTNSIKVILYNGSDNEYVVFRNDRVAQLILEKICHADVVEVDELNVSERGVKGFGSSGV